ncbi:hypothetical protein NTCA1_23540 [Novosphingobium sp. TCA1]|nr:hypothetical protein NTCA1_23540 [Novosphingobium sp. TCA1]
MTEFVVPKSMPMERRAASEWAGLVGMGMSLPRIDRERGAAGSYCSATWIAQAMTREAGAILRYMLSPMASSERRLVSGKKASTTTN